MYRILTTACIAGLLFIGTPSRVAAETKNPLRAIKLPTLVLSDADREARKKLALHCIAVEKDGIAVDPWVFLHGKKGKDGASFFTPRTSLSLQGRDHVLNLPSEADLPKEQQIMPGEKERWLAMNEGKDRHYLPLRDAIIPEMLEAAAKTRKGLLIFVHGGNNALDGAIDRAENLIDPIMYDGYYPVFICWNSNLLSTWGEHLASVRNGADYRARGTGFKIMGWATAPVYLASDLATAAARSPRTALDKIASTFEGDEAIALRYYPDVRRATRRYLALRDREMKYAQPGKYYPALDRDGAYREAARALNSDYEHDLGRRVDYEDSMGSLSTDRWGAWLRQREKLPDKAGDVGRQPMTVSMGQFKSTIPDHITRFAGYWGLLPAKAAVVGAFTGGGENMWGMMNRRIDCMFYHTRSFGEGNFDETDPDLAESAATGIGAASVLFRQIEARQAHGRHLDLTLVGHSMGGLVLNDAVALFPKVKCRTIAYMAPACSIGDFNYKVGPYLRANPDTQFYNLCLHPRAEKRERSVGDSLWGELVPRGSLLDWIDVLLQHPRSFPDRTLGQFENAMLASRMFHPRIQGQIHLCALAAEPGGSLKPSVFTQYQHGPTHHGDFSSYQFWCREFYTAPGWSPRDGFKLDKGTFQPQHPCPDSPRKDEKSAPAGKSGAATGR